MEWFETSLPLFLLLLCRVTAFFVIAPIFSGYGVPPQFRIGLAALFTLLVAGTLQGNEGIAFDITFPLLVIQEVAIGISLGFIAMLFFTAMQVAGTVIDVQMGFILANVIDPQTGAQTPLTGSFKYLLAILVFLSLNGHHMLLDGIMSSLQVAPVGRTPVFSWDSGSLAQLMASSFNEMFVLAFKMAAPIAASLFLVDIGLGVIARTVPQMNIFGVGLPVKIVTSFVVLLLSLPGFVWILDRLFRQIATTMRALTNVVGA